MSRAYRDIRYAAAMRRLVALVGWAFAASVIVAACGARSELPAPFVGVEPSGEGGRAAGPECSVYNSSATLSPLDLYVMLDLSGSMDIPTEGGLTKWQAVKNALYGFFYDAESAGISISIGYFPIFNTSASEFCIDSAVDCGLPNQCTPLSVCGTENVPCETQSDCVDAGFPAQPCVWLGTCPGLGGPFTGECRPDVGVLCPDGTGPCTPLGYCENRVVCLAEPYADLPVQLEYLPGAADDLFDELEEQFEPAGATPTLPALQGVSQAALARADGGDERNVVVLLATDGAPSACDPALDGPDPETGATDSLVEVASGTLARGVRTFVVGVFSPDDEPVLADNVQRIAEAGGTEEAFVIESSQSVASAFQEALNQIRLDAKACEFTILADDEDPLDYDDVWVRIVDDDGEEVWVELRGDAAACDPDTGGFYYDPPPDSGAETVRIVLCPASCTLLGATVNRQAEVHTTCPAPR